MDRIGLTFSDIVEVSILMDLFGHGDPRQALLQLQISIRNLEVIDWGRMALFSNENEYLDELLLENTIMTQNSKYAKCINL